MAQGRECRGWAFLRMCRCWPDSRMCIGWGRALGEVCRGCARPCRVLSGPFLPAQGPLTTPASRSGRPRPPQTLTIVLPAARDQTPGSTALPVTPVPATDGPGTGRRPPAPLASPYESPRKWVSEFLQHLGDTPGFSRLELARFQRRNAFRSRARHFWSGDTRF